MPSTKALLHSAIFGLLATTAPFASAHTWVEQLMVIAPNGTLVGQPGFARGNVLRGTPGFSDPAMVNLIPPDGRPINQIEPTDLMCKSTQTSQTQTDGSPRLQAAPGSAVALRFQENGHVTLPDNQPGKPKNRGTVYVYGTTQPSPDDSFLAIHRVWNAEGTGGDGRGVLLSTRNFDDGQCYQVNGGQISQQRQQQFKHAFNSVMGNDLWCQQDIQLPADAPTGKPYTLYWVWDWPTMPGTPGFPNGKQEIYTTCMDIDIVSDDGVGTVSKAQAAFAQGQAVDNAAVADEFSDIANPTAVTVPGGASEASVVAATSSETGIPAFLTVHTGSTAGPGAETQSFTVIPIGVSTTAAQASASATGAQSSQQTGSSGQGRGGRGGTGNGRGGNDAGESNLASSLSSVISVLNSLGVDLGPQVTSAPNADAAVATFTEYESITETVFQTVYNTRYTKRDGESESSSSILVSPTVSLTTGPRANASFAPGEPHSVFRGTAWKHRCDCSNHHNGTAGPRNGNGGSYGGRGYGHGRPCSKSVMPLSLTTTVTSGRPASVLPATDAGVSASGSVMTMYTQGLATPTHKPFPPLDFETTRPSLNPVPSAIPTSALSSNLVAPSSGPNSLTLIFITDSAPAPTVAPVLPRAAEPEEENSRVSTDHSAFRLRARNPFVWLGWTLSSSDAMATATAFS
ncbi:hypothetical protein HRR78_002984 [Exophiala dermatitidis]|nr:hypothetical protein HRR75_004904 [Exophiala dermatitidis]KAJ4554580.1 hypothetical protein HRR78_002984 [Exophiala dermatitidis]